MNAQAVEVERRYERAIMSSFHALFSAGGLVGAALAGAALAAGAGDASHVVGAAVLSTAALAAALSGLIPTAASLEHPGPVLARPTGPLARLGALAFCGLLVEGAMEIGAPSTARRPRQRAAVAAFGFAAFSLTMAAGRATGDILVARFGPERSCERLPLSRRPGWPRHSSSRTPWRASSAAGSSGSGSRT